MNRKSVDLCVSLYFYNKAAGSKVKEQLVNSAPKVISQSQHLQLEDRAQKWWNYYKGSVLERILGKAQFLWNYF